MSARMFIKFDEPGITGEATASDHSNEIEVLSWSHSFNQPTSATRSSAGGGTVEQANHSDFTFVKYLDAATDDLLKMCWSGKQIGKATFCAYRANGDNTPVKYLEIAMDKVVVSNLSLRGRQWRPADREHQPELRQGTVQLCVAEEDRRHRRRCAAGLPRPDHAAGRLRRPRPAWARRSWISCSTGSSAPGKRSPRAERIRSRPRSPWSSSGCSIPVSLYRPIS